MAEKSNNGNSVDVEDTEQEHEVYVEDTEQEHEGKNETNGNSVSVEDTKQEHEDTEQEHEVYVEDTEQEHEDTKQKHEGKNETNGNSVYVEDTRQEHEDTEQEHEVFVEDTEQEHEDTKQEDEGKNETNGNSVYVEDTEQEYEGKNEKKQHRKGRVTQTLPEVLNRLPSAILFPEPADGGSLLRRIKNSVADNVPLLPEASRNSARDVLLWTRRGSPLRALPVISVGTVTCVALAGLLVFMLFYLAATINAIVISLLISLAAAGGFLALFFASATAIYIGALSTAIFVISVTTFWTIVAILITSGWVGFFYTVWLVTRKSFGFAKHSLSATGSAIASYSTARHANYVLQKDSD